jgi:serine/threonine protein kinase
MFVAQMMRSALGPINRLHQLGLANRDIKPDHFLVSAEGPDVQWIDFGMAEEIASGGSDRRKSVPGTRLYISPEDLNGAPPSVTGDIYSIGATMYELLAGRTAHNRPDRPEPVRTGPPLHMLDRLAIEDRLVDDVLNAQEAAQTDTKLDLKVRQEWVEEEIDMSVLEEKLVPSGLVAVVETAVARDPADRYPSVVSMSEGLEYFVQGQVMAA